MNQDRLYKVLLAPHVSEKASIVGDKHNQVVFKVARDATKLEIRKAVELLFDVKVTNVRTVNVKGKVKRFQYTVGKRADWKKAYVTLAEGNDIDFLGAEG